MKTKNPLAFLLLVPALSFAQGPMRPGVPAEPAGPVNPVVNPGFEKGLAPDATKGWMDVSDFGGEAKIASFMNPADQPPEGKKALSLKIKKPPRYPAKLLNGVDYGPFRDFAAKEQPRAMVRQNVPVVPGKRYGVRMKWKGTGLANPKTAPGPDRGVAEGSVVLLFVDKAGKRVKDSPTPEVPKFRTNPATWQECFYPAKGKDGKMPGAGAFVLAPEGAAYLRVDLKLISTVQGAKPELLVDDFEVFAY
ncbi:MAG: hypothetical protein IJ678_08320, partial [Kiritimatiellae bacterium]|nr:hypothetical protein [Kiritimatiellia bacterium]